MENKSKKIEELITNLHNAKNDNDKFAGCLFAAHVVKSDNLTTSDKRKVFTAIGGYFIERLLRTKNVPEGCGEYVYKDIAINILKSFSDDQELIKEEFIDFLPYLLTIINLVPDNEEAKDTVEKLIENTYDCLNAIIQASFNSSKFDINGIIKSLCTTVIAQNFSYTKALDLLEALLPFHTEILWTEINMHEFHKIMSLLLKLLESATPIKKVARLKLIRVFVNKGPSLDLTDLNRRQWANDLSIALLKFIKSKLTVKDRQQVLMLASACVGKYGCLWLTATSIEDRNKIIILLARLACIEYHISFGSSKEISEVYIDSNTELYVTMCSLMANILVYIIENCDSFTDSEQIRQFKDAFVTSIEDMCAIIVSIGENNQVANHIHPITLSSLRVIGTWGSEETDLTSDHLVKAIPSIIKICEKFSQQDPPTDAWSFILRMLHSLIISKEEVRERILKACIHLKLIDMTTEKLKSIKIDKSYTENFVDAINAFTITDALISLGLKDQYPDDIMKNFLSYLLTDTLYFYESHMWLELLLSKAALTLKVCHEWNSFDDDVFVKKLCVYIEVLCKNILNNIYETKRSTKKNQRVKTKFFISLKFKPFYTENCLERFLEIIENINSLIDQHKEIIQSVIDSSLLSSLLKLLRDLYDGELCMQDMAKIIDNLLVNCLEKSNHVRGLVLTKHIKLEWLRYHGMVNSGRYIAQMLEERG
ncbi:DgyrCDS13127 [Dimorphilus gyrociliatus]|uniref:DgyrCDS13127 n=1 Tax=Dimorphilus gyrociliatus TaxID=2664684 RepID=A0A7I8W9Q9_9ANNE|nr:DgyrCDS13127 [Dimorphilus gyrociliatus]